MDRKQLTDRDVLGTKLMYAAAAGTFIGGLAFNWIVAGNESRI
jgi:hypothetical protein